MDAFKIYLKLHKPRNIIILSGAGVSTGAGLPDYRTTDNLLKVFQRHYSNKTLFEDSEFIAFKDQVAHSTPTASHQFVHHLDKLGLLKRVYTQNVDGLYGASDRIVEFHGSIQKQNIVLYGDPISQLDPW
jgi:NAD-dependent SIR2 family protein deacetylase